MFEGDVAERSPNTITYNDAEAAIYTASATCVNAEIVVQASSASIAELEEVCSARATACDKGGKDSKASVGSPKHEDPPRTAESVRPIGIQEVHNTTNGKGRSSTSSSILRGARSHSDIDEILEEVMGRATRVIGAHRPRQYAEFRGLRDELAEIAKSAPEGSEVRVLIDAVSRRLEAT